jgi:Tol biopolymer transport system component
MGDLASPANPARLGILGTIAGFILAFAFSHPASAAFPGPNGRIAFASGYRGGGISTIRPNGERLRHLVGNYSSEPAFSADGRRIVFMRYRLGVHGPEIYKMHADGSHKVRLTHSRAIEWGPSFSPSGRSIVFARTFHSNQYDLWKMRAGGGQKKRLTHTRASETSPKFSPNGRRILFVRELDLAIMKANGSHAHRIRATPNVFESSPDFSPDGSRIVFSRNSVRRQPYEDIFSVRADGSDLRRLTRSNADDIFPAFSPNGRRIAFARKPRRPAGGDYRIYKMRADGSRLRRVTRGGGRQGSGSSPSWGRAR